MKSEQLLTQGKIFEDEILAGPECTNNPAEDVPEPYDHAKNLTETLSIELGAKSLILRVYDVLMNDNEMSLYWMNKTNGTILGCAAADGRPRWLAPTTNRFTCAAKARLVCYGRFRGGKRKRRDKRLMGGELTDNRATG